jgi:hypothetical protein
MGYTAAPVVIAGDTHFSGYHPDKLVAIAESIADQGHDTTPRRPERVIEDCVLTSAPLQSPPADNWHMNNGVIAAADRSSRVTASSRPPSWAGNSSTSASQRARRR